MAKTIDQRLDEMVELLRCNAPLVYPVEVLRTRTPQDCIGDWRYADGYHRIRLSWILNWRETRDTLLHEWAHALDHESGEGNGMEHGPSWGVQHAKVYRIFHKCD